MNYLFLSESFYPHYGGAELATYLYAKRLAGKGNKIVVLTNRFPNEPEVSRSKNIVIYRLNLLKNNDSKYSVFFRFDTLISSFLRRLVKWSDIVYIPRLWLNAIPYVKKLGKPVMVHLHDYFPICPLSTIFEFEKKSTCSSPYCKPSCVWLTERYQNRTQSNAFLSSVLNPTLGSWIGGLVNFADSIICVSNAQKEILVRRLPNLQKKIHVIYNPMPDVSDIALEGNDFGYFGGNNQFKGISVLCESLKIIKKQGQYNPIIYATKMLTQNYSYNSYLGKLGVVAYDKLGLTEFEQMYSSIQTVIVPSIWPEPLPYVVAEALIRGRLLIASKIGGIPELLNGCRGVIEVEPSNTIQLADAISKIMNIDDEEKMRMGRQNRETFLRRFNDEANLNRFISLAESLI